MDWITLSIEIIGLIILVIWTLIPIQEFKAIFSRLNSRQRESE